MNGSLNNIFFLLGFPSLLISQSVSDSILLDEIELFESKELKNKKSVLFKLSFQDPKKTLEDNQVNSIITEIISLISKKFDAKLRDQ